MPAELQRIVGLRNGIVLVTGPTGSGKSSTLAAIIDLINKELSVHILTIEDPNRTEMQQIMFAPIAKYRSSAV